MDDAMNKLHALARAFWMLERRLGLVDCTHCKSRFTDRRTELRGIVKGLELAGADTNKALDHEAIAAAKEAGFMEWELVLIGWHS